MADFVSAKRVSPPPRAAQDAAQARRRAGDRAPAGARGRAHARLRASIRTTAPRRGLPPGRRRPPTRPPPSVPQPSAPPTPPRPRCSDFAPFTDPRRNVGSLSDALAVRAVSGPDRDPLRTVGSGDAASTSSGCASIPTTARSTRSRPMLSATELANAKLYWQGIWRAGGIEADRARRLAQPGRRARLGPRRLHRRHLSAGQPADRPPRPPPTDEILVIPTQTPLAAAEAAAIAAYWQAIWLADGDAGAAAGGARRARSPPSARRAPPS